MARVIAHYISLIMLRPLTTMLRDNGGTHVAPNLFRIDKYPVQVEDDCFDHACLPFQWCKYTAPPSGPDLVVRGTQLAFLKGGTIPVEEDSDENRNVT